MSPEFIEQHPNRQHEEGFWFPSSTTECLPCRKAFSMRLSRAHSDAAIFPDQARSDVKYHGPGVNNVRPLQAAAGLLETELCRRSLSSGLMTTAEKISSLSNSGPESKRRSFAKDKDPPSTALEDYTQPEAQSMPISVEKKRRHHRFN